MAVSGRWFSLVLVLSSSIEPGFAQGNNTDLLHIPWACSVMHLERDLIGAGSIITRDNVLVSVDNFNEKAAPDQEIFLRKLNDVAAFAGSNFVYPYRVVHGENGTRTLPVSDYVQRRAAKALYVAFKIPESIGGAWVIESNPNDTSEEAGAENNAYGLVFNVGILVLTEPFLESSYVKPMLVKITNLKLRTNQFKRDLRVSFKTRFCITYSWNQKLNTIRYHEVIYLPEENCLEVFCNWDIRNCRQFPMKDHLVCFKAVNYVDVCPKARGAALYCPDFENSVFAVLTSAPSCGQRHMPGVYTTIPWVIEFFEKAFERESYLGRMLPYKLFSLPQRASDYFLN